jgi:signal transduction histidine kinase
MQTGVPAVFAHAAMNAGHFVESGSALEVRSRFLVLALALASGVLAARARSRRELAFHAWNLGSILVAALLTYIFGPWADYRVFAAHLLLTQILLATSRVEAARRLALLALLAQVASAGPFAEAFTRLDESYRYDPARIEAFGAAARQGVGFDASQDAWCNTLVSVNPPYLYPEMVELPGGVGVTIFFGWQGTPQQALRSRYVLLDPDDAQRWTVGAPAVTHVGPDQVRIAAGQWLSMNLRPIAATPVGTLYRNLDARCPGG